MRAPRNDTENGRLRSCLVDPSSEPCDGTAETRYFHQDHLGSIAAISDETGQAVERLSDDAWGQRRFPTGADDPAGSIAGSVGNNPLGFARTPTSS